jgi:hypothetical protein
MEFNRRSFLGAAAATTLGAGLAAGSGGAAAAGGAVTPEQFGAKGDGVTNDTDAFARLTAHVNRQGGGEIALRKTTYLVGRQLPSLRSSDFYAFDPAKIMEFTGLTRPLVIRGNGARLKCAPGLRFGAFNRASGRTVSHPMPNFAAGELASPYRWMIRVADCTGPVEITDLELDGSVGSLLVGGQYGDTGWQVPATGIGLYNNRGAEKIARVHSHHHALDGLLIDGFDGARGGGTASLIEDVRCEHNGRQGCSVVGGRGYAFRNCKFNHSGKAGVASAPGAGVDIEAEGGKKVRDLSFSGCEFSNNIGAGLVADSGDSEGASFSGCTFIGTTNWAAWPNKPRFRFAGCTFVGAIVRAFGDPRPERATQFHDCSFRDDPALSPTRQVYGGENPDRPIADLPDNKNVLFNRCRFVLTHRSVLPWSTNVTYADCTLSQAAPKESYPRGTFIGRNRITGRSNLYGSSIRGEVLLNGRPMPRGVYQ